MAIYSASDISNASDSQAGRCQFIIAANASRFTLLEFGYSLGTAATVTVHRALVRFKGTLADYNLTGVITNTLLPENPNDPTSIATYGNPGGLNFPEVPEPIVVSFDSCTTSKFHRVFTFERGIYVMPNRILGLYNIIQNTTGQIHYWMVIDQ